MTGIRTRRVIAPLVTAAAIALGAATATALLVSAARPADVLDLPTEPWWGGPSTFAAWPKAAEAGWSDPSFFPIAVFFGKPEHAERLAELGINTYMGAERDGTPLSDITSAGISVIAQPEWTDEEVGEDPRVVGWHVSDECDMGLGGCDSADGETGSLAIQEGFVRELRAKNDGRFLQANFGNGVLGSYWSPTTMPDHVALMDVTSVDKYAYTSPHVQELLMGSPAWPVGRAPGSAFAYGWQQDRMASFAEPAASVPNWVFVETARPFLTEDGAKTITVERIRGAAWNAIIHGAAGIAYFQHNNDPACGVYSLVECGAGLSAGVAHLNAEITGLASVINTPSYVWDAGGGVDTALKARDGFAYLFAMTDGGTGARTLRLPPGTAGAVTVLGEDREIALSADGTFVDDFSAESAVHLYRVAIGGLR
jgi:hypothetical protein